MTKYDRNFCKPDENDKPLYCPLPLAVVIHHHEEGDDPETGEHWEHDWDERRTEVFPTDPTTPLTLQRASTTSARTRSSATATATGGCMSSLTTRRPRRAGGRGWTFSPRWARAICSTRRSRISTA